MKTKNYLLVLSLSIPAFMPSVTLAMGANANFDRKPVTTLLAQFGGEGFIESARRHQIEFANQEMLRQQSEESVRAEQRKYKEQERVRLLAIKLEEKRDYIGLGDLLATQQGEGLRVVRAYKTAIAANPRSPAGYISLGNFLSNQGNFEGSISSFNAAISVDPHSFDAHFGRARAKNGKGDFRGAVADYDRSINISPEDSVGAYYNRALLKKNRLNDRAGAIQDFRRAAQIYRVAGDSENSKLSISHLQDLGATE
jgi:tetratricopeptide (TPR) repeat protein